MRTLALVGTGEQQRALLHRLHGAAPLSEVGLVHIPRQFDPGLSQRLAMATVGLPLRAAWRSVMEHYRKLHPALPDVRHEDHDGVNADSVVAQVERLRPELVLVSGTDLLRQPLINAIQRHGRVMNLHTGLSPYIRGGPNCTNWALALGEFGLIGNTVMWLDAGIDTGRIIATERTPLSGSESLGELHLKVMEHAHDLYSRAFARFADGGELPSHDQKQIGGKGRLFLNRQWTAGNIARAVYNFHRSYGPDAITSAERVALVPLSTARGGRVASHAEPKENLREQ